MISSRIFRSRWSALIWSGGILWTAYDVASAVPDAPPAAHGQRAAVLEDATGTAVDPADLAVLANVAG